MTKRIAISAACALALSTAASLGQQRPEGEQGPRTHVLKASPTTVAWGHYHAKTAPCLRIKSGDSVEFHTLLTSSPTRLEGAGVPAEQVEPALRDIHREVKDKGPGGHILTGPVFVEGAEPGDVLEVRIRSIGLAIPYSYNAFGPRSGTIPEDFPTPRMRIIPLDRERMVAPFGEGIEIPLRPFFGSMGVAPPEAAGRISSAPPGIHAGNLDNKELVAGTTLSSPSTSRAPSSRSATATPRKATARSTSRPWKPRSSARSNSRCGRTCTSPGPGPRPPPTSSRWASTRTSTRP